MHARMRGKVARQVGAQRIYHEGGAFGGNKQRNVELVGNVQQKRQGLLAVGNDHDGRFQLNKAFGAAHKRFRVVVGGQVFNLARAQHLYSVGMDVVEVIHQV